MESGGPPWTQGSHHLNPATSVPENETNAAVGSSQNEGSDTGVQQSRHKDAKSVPANDKFDK